MQHFRIPRTQTAPNHPSNSPCPMRPWSPWIEQPFYYHPDRTLRRQRITFYGLPYEIHMIIYKFIVSKEPKKFPLPDDLEKWIDTRQEEEEALMGQAMENFLYGIEEEEEEEEEAEGEVTLDPWGVTFADNPLADNLPDPEIAITNSPPTAVVSRSPSVSEIHLTRRRRKHKKITYATNNAYELLKSAQRNPSDKWKLDPDRYLNTDDVWGMLSFVRTCRLVYANFAPLLLGYLVNATFEIYTHEVKRSVPGIYGMIIKDDPRMSDRLFAYRKDPLVGWDQIQEDEVHADEAANPEGYKGLTPFNQFPGHEYDEWEQFVHRDDEYDWNGMLSGCTGLDWSDPWHLNALVFTACHDEVVMGDFLRQYVKMLKSYKGGKWTRWFARDVMLVLVQYPTFRLDPWVENYLRKEFQLEGFEKRQTTMEEFMIRMDKNAKV